MVTYLGLIVIAGVIAQAVFIALEHKEQYVAADVFKGAASLMFVLLGTIGYLTCKGDAFAIKILIGLIFGMIGDIVMNLRFVLKEGAGQKAFLGGILAFLIGHILYLAALCPKAPHILINIITGGIAAAGLLTYIFKTMEVKKAFKIFGVFYLGAVIIMTVMALDIAIFTGTTQAIVYAVGAVLFTASDIVLIFNTFSGTTRFPLRVTNLSLYYVGQLLIAGCLFLK